MTSEKQWFLYMIRCKFGTLYTGVTTDVERRFSEHQGQGIKCAKYLKGKAPLELIYSQKMKNKIEAYRLELKIKGLTKEQKKVYIELANNP
ncbi:MAG TPA: hypothetical protein DD412_01185 [Holosporales bacterium]|nr:hypothetical protein [Holosporales bacterium]